MCTTFLEELVTATALGAALCLDPGFRQYSLNKEARASWWHMCVFPRARVENKKIKYRS